MTDLERRERLIPRGAIYPDRSFRHARRPRWPKRPYVPPSRAMRLLPPPAEDDEALDVRTPLLWQVLIPLGLVLSLLLGVALALGLALLVLTLGSEIARVLLGRSA